MSPKLALLQQYFKQKVLSNDDTVSPFVNEPKRLAIYRNTVQNGLADVLAAAFPVVARIVGQAHFKMLARTFVISAPPRIPQLSAYGGDFVNFIAASDIAKNLPYLPDTAALEWARNESYFAASAAFLDPSTLTRLTPPDLEALKLTLHPATRLVRSAFPIYRIWEVNQPTITDVPRVDMDVSENALVSRPNTHVIVRAISDADAAFIASIESGSNFGKAAEQGLEKDAAFDLQAALAQHFLNGTFEGL